YPAREALIRAAALERRLPLMPLRVFADLAEVEEHTVLVADDFRVMPRRDRDDLAGRELLFAAVVPVDAHAALHAVPEMRYLARVGACDRLDVGRPAPTGLERATLNGPAGYRHDLRHSMALEHPRLVGLVERLDFDTRHCPHPRRAVGSPRSSRRSKVSQVIPLPSG